MARQACILIPTPTVAATSTGPTDIVLSLTTTAAQTVTLHKNQIFVINAAADVNISFGLLANLVVATATNCYRIPANQQTTFDIGPNQDSFSIVNNVTGTTAVFIKCLSVN